MRKATCLLDSPESNLVMLPFGALDGIALPSNIGLDLSSKLVRNTTAGALHGSEVGGSVKSRINIVYESQRSSEVRGNVWPQDQCGQGQGE